MDNELPNPILLIQKETAHNLEENGKMIFTLRCGRKYHVLRCSLGLNLKQTMLQSEAI
jgi:hypothetical protein